MKFDTKVNISCSIVQYSLSSRYSTSHPITILLPTTVRPMENFAFWCSQIDCLKMHFQVFSARMVAYKGGLYESLDITGNFLK